MKINMDKVKSTMVTGGKVLLNVAVFALPFYSQAKKVVTDVRYTIKVEYSDVVNVILNSNMMSSTKAEVVTLLPKDGNTEMYRSVIAVVESNMMSSDKVKMIKDICGSIEEESQQ